MKNLIKTLIVLSLTFFSLNSFASGGATGAMQINRVQNLVGMGGASAYAASHMPCCSGCKFRRFSACMKVFQGIAQVLQFISQFKDTTGKMEQFGIGEFPSIDDLNGLCLNPEASGCTQDALDVQISEGPIGDALRKGDNDALIAAANQIEGDMNNLASELEAQGYTLDQASGTLTGPQGNIGNLASMANDPNASFLPSNVQKALSEKLAALGESGNSGKNGGAGGAGAGGGVRVVDEFLDADGLKGRRGLASLNGKKKKTNEDFLAAMADKAGEGAIGVAGDDIFKMIQRRYDKKKKTKEFIFR